MALQKVKESNLNEASAKKKEIPKPDDAAALVSEDFEPFGKGVGTSDDSEKKPIRRRGLPPLPGSNETEGKKVREISKTNDNPSVEEVEEYETTDDLNAESEVVEESEEDPEVENFEDDEEDATSNDEEEYEEEEYEEEEYEEEEYEEEEYEEEEYEEEYEEECEEDEAYEDEEDEDEEDYENEDSNPKNRFFPNIGYKKSAPRVISAPRVKTSDDTHQMRRRSNVPPTDSSTAQKKRQKNTRAQIHDVNFDGYYDDRLPAILDEVTKASYVDIVVKGILAIACIIALIVYCIYYVNV